MGLDPARRVSATGLSPGLISAPTARVVYSPTRVLRTTTVRSTSRDYRTLSSSPTFGDRLRVAVRLVVADEKGAGIPVP